MQLTDLIESALGLYRSLSIMNYLILSLDTGKSHVAVPSWLSIIESLSIETLMMLYGESFVRDKTDHYVKATVVGKSIWTASSRYQLSHKFGDIGEHYDELNSLCVY